MKKLFLSLIAVIAVSSISTAQTREEFEALSVVKTEKINLSNALVSRFYSVTSFKTTNPDIKFSDSDVNLLTLKNGHQALQFGVTGSSQFNIVYSVYDQPSNDFMYFFINSVTNKIELFSPDRELLVTANNVKGFAVLSLVTQGRSAFGKCMDAVEDEFTDDFIGWVAWNTNPGVSATAAIHCQGCVRGWWACPPAYTATLSQH